MPRRHLWRVAAAAAIFALGGCVTPGVEVGAPDRPRLVVLLVIDGLPQRQLVDYRAQLAPDGLRRFLDRGAWFANAHYEHANTLTGPGHAVTLTGAYPHRSGIIANEWRDPRTGQVEYCTGDPAHAYIGHATSRLDGTSPRNLLVETVGDVLRRADARSRVIAVSGKDRGAILPAGASGTAYMYQRQTGQFASSTYYMKAHPPWVAAFNDAKPAERYFNAQWQPLLPDAAYAPSVPDGQTWFAAGGQLPKTLGEGQEQPGPLFYGALVASPFGDQLTVDFARAALEGEALGRDDAPDILSVSLSAHDYINHAYGPESRISHDHVLHVDRMLEAFFQALDAAVGKDRYLVALTADHGFMPVPEYLLSRGLDSGRANGSLALANMNARLSEKYGEGRWAWGFSAGGVILDHDLITRAKVDADAVAEEARNALLAEPGVLVAYTRRELESGSRLGSPFFEAVRKSWHPERSADIQYVLKPYWIGGGRVGTTHGSPHSYDSHVPLAFYGPAWVKAERIDSRVQIADLAPTLAAILRIPPPAAAEGRALVLGVPSN